MRLYTLLLATTTLVTTALSAPVNKTETPVEIPEEALIGFIDFDGEEISALPISNGTHSGILLINNTITGIAHSQVSGTKSKREADADADADADAWHWLSFSLGEPLYKREAKAEPWHWLSFSKGEPLYKREAEAWHWLSFSLGEPLY